MIRIFRHYIPRLVLLLAVLEAVLLVASVHIGVAVRFYGETLYLIPDHVIWITSLIFAAILLVTLHAMGLYRREMREDFWDSIFRLGSGFLLGLSIVTLFYYLLPQLYIGRGAFGIAFGIAFSVSIALRAVMHKMNSSDRFRRKILVVGTEQDARSLTDLSDSYSQSSFRVVGWLPLDDQISSVGAVGESIGDVPRLHCEADSSLSDLIGEWGVEEVVAVEQLRPSTFEALMQCKLQGIPVTQAMTFYERESGQIRLDVMNRSGLLFSEGYRRTTLQVYAKRLFDIACSLVLLIVSWPVMLLTSLALVCESRGKDPVFYRQIRTGEFGRDFEVIKFRSMTVDAEVGGVAQWAQKNDPRVTKVGAFIRNTRIDELPQLFNVLKGEMSFVGPRPERPVFIDELSEQIEHFRLRHLVKPGITGWAQISYPYGASVEDSRQKLQYDLYYIKNQTMFLDLAIVLQTVYVILWGEGAR